MKIEVFLKNGIEELNKPRQSLLARSFYSAMRILRSLWSGLVSMLPTLKRFKKEPFKAAAALVKLLILIGFIYLVIFQSGIVQDPEFLVRLIEMLVSATVAIFLWVFIFAIGINMILQLHPDIRYQKYLIKKYRKQYGLISFSQSQYKQAAKVLREFDSMTHQKAKTKYKRPILDLLVLASAIESKTVLLPKKEKYFNRIVSIKAIERGRTEVWTD